MKQRKKFTPMQVKKEQNRRIDFKKWKAASKNHNPNQINQRLMIPVTVVTLFIMFGVLVAYLLGVFK